MVKLKQLDSDHVGQPSRTLLHLLDRESGNSFIRCAIGELVIHWDSMVVAFMERSPSESTFNAAGSQSTWLEKLIDVNGRRGG